MTDVSASPTRCPRALRHLRYVQEYQGRGRWHLIDRLTGTVTTRLFLGIAFCQWQADEYEAILNGLPRPAHIPDDWPGG